MKNRRTQGEHSLVSFEEESFFVSFRAESAERKSRLRKQCAQNIGL